MRRTLAVHPSGRMSICSPGSWGPAPFAKPASAGLSTLVLLSTEHEVRISMGPILLPNGSATAATMMLSPARLRRASSRPAPPAKSRSESPSGEVCLAEAAQPRRRTAPLAPSYFPQTRSRPAAAEGATCWGRRPHSRLIVLRARWFASCVVDGVVALQFADATAASRFEEVSEDWLGSSLRQAALRMQDRRRVRRGPERWRPGPDHTTPHGLTGAPTPEG